MLKTLKDKLSELHLKQINLLFDGSEGGCFWLQTVDNLYEISISEAKKIKHFLDYWLSIVDNVNSKGKNK